MNQTNNQKGNAGCGIAVIVVIILIFFGVLLGSCDDSSSKNSSRSSGGNYSSTTMGAAEYIRQNDPDLYDAIQERYDSAVRNGW